MLKFLEETKYTPKYLIVFAHRISCPSIVVNSQHSCLCLGPIRMLMRPRHQGGAHGDRAPAKIVRAPAKTVLFMLKNRKRPNGDPVFHGGWSRRLSHTHSYPGCHPPDRLVVALADHGCSQYTSIAAYDY